MEKNWTGKSAIYDAIFFSDLTPQKNTRIAKTLMTTNPSTVVML